MTVPPRRGWRLFARWEWLVIAFFGGHFMAGLYLGAFEYRFFFAAILLLVVTLYTFWRSDVFLVSEQEVCVGFVRGDGYVWTRTWPRTAVGQIKMNRGNGKLLIRITGEDFIEFSMPTSRPVTEKIAHVLQEALVEPINGPDTEHRGDDRGGDDRAVFGTGNSG